MTIECYLDLCPEHSFHEPGPVDGPFCHLDKCIQSKEYIDYISRYKQQAERDTQIIASVPIIPIRIRVESS